MDSMGAKQIRGHPSSMDGMNPVLCKRAVNTKHRGSPAGVRKCLTLNILYGIIYYGLRKFYNSFYRWYNSILFIIRSIV